MGREANLNRNLSKQQGEKAMEFVDYGKPLNGLILLKKTGEVRAKVGGIHIPENAREKPCEGVVIAIGGERITDFGAVIPGTVKVGDRVMYGKYAGIEVKIDENEFMIMKENELFMILPPKSEEEMKEDEAERSFIMQ